MRYVTSLLLILLFCGLPAAALGEEIVRGALPLPAGILGSSVTSQADPADMLIVNGDFSKKNNRYRLIKGADSYGWAVKPGARKMRFTYYSANVFRLLLAANADEAIDIFFAGPSTGTVTRATTKTARRISEGFKDTAPYTLQTGDELYIVFENYQLLITVKREGKDSYLPYLSADLSQLEDTFREVGGPGLGIFAFGPHSVADRLEFNIAGTLEEKAELACKAAMESAGKSLEGSFATAVWNAMGDSLTGFKGGNFDPIYPVTVGSLLGMGKVNNYGYGSTMIARKKDYAYDSNSFVLRFQSMARDADYITVWGGHQ